MKKRDLCPFSLGVPI